MGIEMYKFIIFFISLSLCLSVQATEQKNSDLQSFIENAEICQHLASEWDSSLPQVQQRYIEEQIDIVCPKAKHLREVIKRGYHDNKKIMEMIERYDF
ncbi:hypothetical protein HGT73_09495 [Rosenbergiella australiborealis]|uniref:Uncharacterized protein n=1 Tax=Rosenbergiella australiborealis TaxID=1544696 RepID=A0ABS5T5H5_9GAMM|nr:hypothetical protein [Rosenbergiella australiborealis]MBT0727615.1 hypothetical protein [Rosenbergiella australiborealis]